MRQLAFLPSLAWFVLCGQLSHSQIVINEFLPDPTGADSGKEFVELINNGPASASLLGLELQFANGDQEAHWVVRWTCAADISLGVGELFLVADRNWQADVTPDVEVYLGLQNGPDAIRLVHGVNVLDLVGYGPLTDVDLVEGSAVSVRVGMALARRPDGNDTDNNALDFVATDPSPGQPNFLPYDLRLVASAMDPPSAMKPGEAITVAITLENHGTETFPTGHVGLQIGTEQIISVLDGNAPGQQRSLIFRGNAGGLGKLPVHLLVPLPISEDFLELSLGFYQVGPGPLVINEIMGSPAEGQGEWVELLVLDANGVNLGLYQVKDEGGNWVPLPEVFCSEGVFPVVAQDPLALVEWKDDIQAQGGASGCNQANPQTASIFAMGQWPSLNNSAPEGRDFADRLYLRDGDGCVVDHVTLGWEIPEMSFDLPSGHSLERIGIYAGTPEGSLWAPSLAQSGSTPGCPNSANLIDSMATGLCLNPPFLDPDAGVFAINLVFEVQSPGVGWDLRIFDLWGQLVRDLGGEMHGPGPRQLVFDGRDDQGNWLATGAYVVLLRIRTSDGGILARDKKLAAIRRSK